METSISMNKIICAISFILTLVFINGCSPYRYVKDKITDDTPEPKEFATGNKCEATNFRTDRIIKYINQIRANAQICGEKPYQPAQAVSWNVKLFNAAQAHSRDMAANNFFSHLGSNDSNVSARVANQEYQWNAVAENISGGTDTPEQTLESWMASPGHCRNLMNPQYSEIGMSCAVNVTSEYGIYWTIVLASTK